MARSSSSRLLPFLEGASFGGGLLAEDVELFGEHLFEGGTLVRLEPVDRVVLLDSSFDGLDQDGFEGAVGAFLVAADADEVGVDPSGAASGVGDDQPAAALAAEDRALEVVMVDSLLLAGLVVGREDVLDALPGRLADERLVAAVVFDAAVADDPLVVGVPEQLVKMRALERLGGCPRAGA